MITNKDCKLYDSSYCELLNMQACENCSFGEMKYEEDAQSVRNDLDALMDLVPEEGIASLFAGDTCLLCADQEHAHKATCYAVTDIGHPEPERIKRNFLGMRTRMRVGSMIPVQISCCDRCRNNYRLLDYLPASLMLLIPVLGLILMSVSSVNRALSAVSDWLPVGIFVASVLVGVGVGMLCRRLIAKAKSKETLLDVWQVPLMAKLKDIGWSALTEEKKGNTRMIFSKKRLQRGVFTGDDAKGRAK